MPRRVRAARTATCRRPQGGVLRRFVASQQLQRVAYELGSTRGRPRLHLRIVTATFARKGSVTYPAAAASEESRLILANTVGIWFVS
jgi:hypothetical protein